jgi:hypothetical protein
VGQGGVSNAAHVSRGNRHAYAHKPGQRSPVVMAPTTGTSSTIMAGLML